MNASEMNPWKINEWENMIVGANTLFVYFNSHH